MIVADEMVAAEEVVDWARIDTHITTRRLSVERMILPAALSYTMALEQLGVPSYHQLATFQTRLHVALGKSYVFGFRRARAEIRALRRLRGDTPVLASRPPRYPELANTWVKTLAIRGVSRFVVAMNGYYTQYLDDLGRVEKLRDRAKRMSHNIALEYVTEALNAGRTLAALGQEEPTIYTADATTLYAMRSERLDRNTCSPCFALHGTVVELLSQDYWDILPPSGCLGQGRCRGIMVYADSPEDLMGSSTTLT